MSIQRGQHLFKLIKKYILKLFHNSSTIQLSDIIFISTDVLLLPPTFLHIAIFGSDMPGSNFVETSQSYCNSISGILPSKVHQCVVIMDKETDAILADFKIILLN